MDFKKNITVNTLRKHFIHVTLSGIVNPPSTSTCGLIYDSEQYQNYEGILCNYVCTCLVNLQYNLVSFFLLV